MRSRNKGLEDIVGATFAVEADPQKASRILIHHIEKNARPWDSIHMKSGPPVTNHNRPAAPNCAAGRSP